MMGILRQLQFRLLLVLIIVATIPIGVVALINYTVTTQLVTEEVEARQREVTQIVSAQVTGFVDNIIRTLQTIGINSLSLGFNYNQLNLYINNYFQGADESALIYKSIWLMNADGNEIGGVANGNAFLRDSLLNRREDEVFFRPQRGEIFFSNVRVINRTPELSISVPIYDENDVFVGAVAAIIDLETTWDVIRDFQLGQTGYVMLLDRRGNIMVHPDNQIVDAQYNLADAEAFVRALRGQAIGIYTYNSPFAGNVIASAIPIAGPNWVLMVERPTQEAFAPIQQAVQNIILGLLIAVFVSGLISALLSRQIARPIVSLRNTVQQFGTGDFDIRSDIRAQDEIGQLARGFNDMATRLKTRIDEISQKNEELRLANEKVLEASRLKDEFLATMSHELRTPLSAILGFSGVLLMDEQLDEEQTFQVERIESNSTRLLNIINDILDISRIQAGRMTFHPVPLNIRAMIEQIHAQLEVLAKDRKIGFNYSISDDVPAEVMLDEDAFIKILTNLCSNGIKFTHKGSVDITVNRNSDQLVIQVSDTGIGIPAHMQDVIFEEFRQADSSSKRAYGGTGLGLAIVRRLAMSLGGTVSVRSKVNEGSTFTVTLPLIEHAEDIKV